MSVEVPAPMLAGERSGFRAIGDPYQGYQEKRRRDALQRQKAARLLSANRARTLALEQEEQDGGSEGAPSTSSGAMDEPLDAEMEASSSYADATDSTRPFGSGSRQQQHKHKRHQRQPGTGGVRAYGLQYGNELMQPEWMTDVPSDLGSNWLVMPRPEGLRCLLVTSRGRTVSWLRNGAPLHRFHSPLPGGSPASAGGGGSAAASAASGDYCILDCIFHPPNNTYYIQDLLCWRGYALYDCAAEFRAYWLASKLQEEGLFPAPPPPPPPPPQAPPGQAVAPPCSSSAGGGAGGGTAATPGVVTSPSQHAMEQGEQQEQAQQRHGRPWRRSGRQGRDGLGGAGQTGPSADVEMGDGDGLEVEQEQGQGRQQAASASYRIVPLPVQPCTLQGLRAAYGSGQSQTAVPGTSSTSSTGAASTPSPGPAPTPATADAPVVAPTAETAAGAGTRGSPAEEVDFLRDGLYFLHRQGHYVPGTTASPLALLWKDLGCSRYLLDTDAQGIPLEYQQTVLAYRPDRTVATEDEPPVVLGRLPEAFVAAVGAKLLRPGRLLRFSIRQGGITFHGGRPAGADLHYEGPANQRRGRADTFSKILFQRLARTAPITLGALEAAAAAAAAASASVAEGAAAPEEAMAGDM